MTENVVEKRYVKRPYHTSFGADAARLTGWIQVEVMDEPMMAT